MSLCLETDKNKTRQSKTELFRRKHKKITHRNLLALRLLIYLIADIIEEEVSKCRKFLLCIAGLTTLGLANITSEPAHYVSESAHYVKTCSFEPRTGLNPQSPHAEVVYYLYSIHVLYTPRT